MENAAKRIVGDIWKKNYWKHLVTTSPSQNCQVKMELCFSKILQKKGRGLSDSTVAHWIKSLPLTIPLCNNLESLQELVMRHQSNTRSKIIQTTQWQSWRWLLHSVARSTSTVSDQTCCYMLVSLSTGLSLEWGLILKRTWAGKTLQQ